MAIETQHIEFKRIWKDDYLKWICGFANSEGGQLFIGVDDSGNVVGLDNPKKLMEDIPNKIASTLGVVVGVNLAEKDAKQYIAVTVPVSSAPVACQGKYYIRSGATLQELSGIALQDFVMHKIGLTWESQAVPDASIDDIDSEAIKYFIDRGIWAHRIPESARNDSVETVLRNRNLIDKNGRLTLAALLLFGKNPQQYCLTARVKIGMFGPGYSDLEGQDIVDGNLIQMADRVMDVLDQKYLMRPIHYEGWVRMEPLEIPDDALREILYNSIIHKDYRGGEITIRVFKDHLEIWNPGKLPEDFDIDKLWERHGSVKRNNLIAEVFYYAGFIENWGRGFEKIHKAFIAENLKLPTFASHTGGFEVDIFREKYVAMSGYDKILDNADTKNVTDGIAEQLSERQRNILVALGIGGTNVTNNVTNNVTKTTDDIAALLGVSKRTILRDLEKMKELGIIVRVGTSKSGYWEIVKK